MPSLTSSQIALLAAPPILLVTTYSAYKGLAARFGPARGYLVGFLFYWTCWCFLLSLLTVGPDGLREMFKAPHPMFGKPNWLGLFLLLGPPLVMYITRFPAEVKGASLTIIIYSALFALVNGPMEEVLWRGAYVTAFPDSWLWAYLYHLSGLVCGIYHHRWYIPARCQAASSRLRSRPSPWGSCGAGSQRQRAQSGGR